MALASQPSRSFLAKWSGVGAPGGVWRVLAILFALMNFKNLPFVWHFRFFKAYWYQIFVQPTPIPPYALFLPVVTQTHAPLLEIDFNMHKSNSTYFADMDISRTHLFTSIVRNAIRKVSSSGFHMPRASNKSASTTPSAVTAGLGASDGTAPKVTGGGDAKYMIALGGVQCNFKKEILPYQKFEMWTRLLTWDRKWFYLVTHLVRPGVGKPTSYSLQPWRKSKRVEGQDVDPEKLKGAVFATAIARYVIKRGRLTIPPEKALFDADMVPEKPEGWVYKGDDGAEMNGTANGAVNGDLEGALPEKGSVEWNWDVIERERRRGLRFAEAYAELDGLHEVWDGGKEGVLGQFPDVSFLYR
ncbi:hypothetical protein BU23DRAFT_485413 [Bimuria novae-zelandiae CBS 107.79]|uniref:Capsule polysaccharide biosynthesis protein n=1 Tax=Bimuria novae-zelandiae CBS 107.79 TaxID=1447943 RepID=A0A6A5UPK7_9PLEO|nr:hypothetical protein BU23DRAFT_485413 [Bimuria novae-zelandiae CBS 107.79]